MSFKGVYISLMKKLIEKMRALLLKNKENEHVVMVKKDDLRRMVEYIERRIRR